MLLQVETQLFAFKHTFREEKCIHQWRQNISDIVNMESYYPKNKYYSILIVL